MSNAKNTSSIKSLSPSLKARPAMITVALFTAFTFVALALQARHLGPYAEVRGLYGTALLGVLGVSAILVVEWLNRLLWHFVVYFDRIELQHGIHGRVVGRVDFSDVVEVKIHQSLVGRVLNVGDVEVFADTEAGSGPAAVTLFEVAGPKDVAQLVDQLRVKQPNESAHRLPRPEPLVPRHRHARVVVPAVTTR